MAVIRWEENLERLRLLIAETPGARPAEFVKTHRIRQDRQVGWLVRRVGSSERLMFIPDSERTESMREVIEGMLDFYYCTSCGERLLQGEEVECSLCEARRVMSIVRLREELA